MSEDLLGAALRSAGKPAQRCALGPGDRLSRALLKKALFGAPALPRVGRYETIRQISSGGMGIVFEARDEVLGRAVALKLLRTDLVGDSAELRARIRREARAMARLSHPNVVQVYEFGEHDGDLFLALEYIDGQTLGAWLAEHAGPAHRAATFEQFIAAGRGLAAAHAAGLIHRDFKPDNVLLSAGGRTLLTDFGLVRASEEEPAAGPAAGAVPVDGLTRAGAVLGTTAYMAPEQIDGRPTDARSDQFSFTVALYEALYGQRPYPGESVAALRAAMRAGRLHAGDEAAAVPGWLRAVLLRGLATAPEDRYPDMDTLLGALLDDLDARQRRRRAAVVVLVAAAVALVLAGDALLQRWQDHRAELAARVSLTALEQQVAVLRDAGDAAEAIRRFDDLIAVSGLARGDALAMAWLREARRREAAPAGVGADGSDPVLSAYTHAFSATSTALLRAEILTALAEALHQRGRWADLGRLLVNMEQNHPDALASPALFALRLDAALAAQDPRSAHALAAAPGGQPELLPVLETLSQAQRLDTTGSIVQANEIVLPGHATPGVLQEHVEGITRTLSLHTELGGPPLHTVHEWPWDRVGPFQDTDGPSTLLSFRFDSAESVLWEPQADGTLVELMRWSPAGHPLASAVADMDGDGQKELYVGQGPPSRGIIQLTRSADGQWRSRSVGDAVAINSDISHLLPYDIDGDGTDELISAIGPWTNYDLQLLSLDPDTEQLRSHARKKLGAVHGAMLLERPGREQLLVIHKVDMYPNVRVFPEQSPFGMPSGLYLLRVRPDRFEVVSHIPSFFENQIATLTVDVDGDGLDDVLEIGFDGANNGFRILRQQPDGTLTQLLVMWGPRLLYATETDGDPGAELVVSLPEYTPDGTLKTRRLWILGTGSDPLPQRARIEEEAPTIEVAAPLAGTQSLAEIGLTAEAAQAFERIAHALDEGAVQQQAWLRAAVLFEEDGRIERALPLYLEAAAAPEQAADALEGALRCDIRAEHYATAIAAAARALAVSSLPDNHRARISEALAKLRALQASGEVLRVQFDGTSGLRWSAETPLGIQRAADGLHVHTHSPGVLLAAPVAYTGGSIVIEAELTFRQMEWSAGLALHLFTPQGNTQAVMVFQAQGGGGLVHHHLLAGTEGMLAAWRGPEAAARLEAGTPVRYRVRCEISPGGGEVACTLYEGETLINRDRAVIPPLPPQEGHHTLELSTVGQPTAALDATLHEIRLTGFAVPDTQQTPTTDRTAAVLDGRLPEALAWAPPGAQPAEQVLRAELLMRTGRLDEGRSLLASLLSQQALPAELLSALRRRPSLVGPVLLSIDPAQAHRAIQEAWWLSRRMHPRAQRSDAQILELLAGLGQDTASAAATRDLLLWRGLARVRREDRVLADADLQQALSLTPADEALTRGQILVELADNAAQMEQPERARLLLTQARALEPAFLIEDWIAIRPSLSTL